MRAVVLHVFGPAENLRYETVPDPVPGPGEVRVSVRAAGVHQIETAMWQGLEIGPPLPELPAIFGGEVAGVVESVGPDVDEAWIGAEVVTAQGLGVHDHGPALDVPVDEDAAASVPGVPLGENILVVGAHVRGVGSDGGRPLAPQLHVTGGEGRVRNGDRDVGGDLWGQVAPSAAAAQLISGCCPGGRR